MRQQMKTEFDAIVIGAGPAGLACSATLAQKGLDVALLDEQVTPGGQIYRNITRTTPAQRSILGKDYIYGLGLVEEFDDAAVEYLPGSRVWQADPNGSVYFSKDGASRRIHGSYLAICTGAMERPVPFPGWTLPGVMTCGGMSNLYKDSGLVPTDPVVIAGSGPLLWLVAEHLLALSVRIAAILDTAPLSNSFSALARMPAAVRRADFLLKGVKMIGAVYSDARRKKVPVFRNVKGIRAEGTEKLERVIAVSGRKDLSFETTTLFVTEGIIPNSNLLRQVGCTHRWNPVQRYWHPAVARNGSSNLERVFVAGDGAFVHGARAAELKGRLAGLKISQEMHRISKAECHELSGPVLKELDHDLHPRPFIDSLYRPGKDLYAFSDETMVCRCEGITAGRIRELVEAGFTDHNDIKAMIRCGMGPCQGRMCSSAVLELIVAGSGKKPETIRQHRLRPPVKPVNLMEMANAEIEDADES